jgi:hypothetical protein
MVDVNDKYNLPFEKDSSPSPKSNSEVLKLQKLLDMYQQNHGHNICIQISHLIGISGLAQRIYSHISKNEKECIQKLKESSTGPLMHYRNNSDSESSISDGSNNNSSDDEELPGGLALTS